MSQGQSPCRFLLFVWPEMDCVTAYKSLGHDFVAITDHNRIGMSRGQSPPVWFVWFVD